MTGWKLNGYLRSYFLQSAWNYDRMQHMGFALAMLPGLRRFHAGNPAALSTAATRHLEYFNTHSYLAPTLIGAALNLEGEVAANRRRPDEVTSFKNSIMGSYGAIGDSFFWAALRPFGAVIAVAMVLLGAGGWGPAAFVIGFDLIAFTLRTWGFFAGVRLGPTVVARLARVDFSTSTRVVKIASAVVAGLVAALWAHGLPAPELPLSAPMITWQVLAFPLVVVLAGTARRGVSPAAAAVVLAAGAAAWKGFS